MKPRGESIEKADFSGPKGEFKNLFLGLKSYRDTFRSENEFLKREVTIIEARSSLMNYPGFSNSLHQYPSC